MNVYAIESLEKKKEDNFLLLRIIAALMVIYGHSVPLTNPVGAVDIFVRLNFGIYSGEIAVLIFFVISGFMVSGSFIKRGNLKEYFAARFLRILPAFMLVLFVSAFLLGPLLTTLDARTYFKDSSVYLYIIKNLSFSSNLAWVLPGVFEENRMHAINGSIWSLSAEMRMYFFVAALGVFGFFSDRRFFAVLFLVCLVFANLNPQVFPLHDDWLKPSAYFCIGIIFQLFKERISIRGDIIIMLIFVTYISRLTNTYSYLFAITLGYFCFWFAYKTKYINLDKYGDPSYGIYLWAWPIQQTFSHIWPNITPFNNFILSAFFSCVMGYLSWHIVEKRALRMKAIFACRQS